MHLYRTRSRCLLLSLCILSCIMALTCAQDTAQTLQEIEAENEELKTKLDGFEECKVKLGGLEAKNKVLRARVDKETPALEQYEKDAVERLKTTVEDARKFKLYFQVAMVTILLLNAKLVCSYLNDAKEWFAAKFKKTSPSPAENKKAEGKRKSANRKKD